MTAFKIDVADGPATAGLARLVESLRRPDPALRAIGEALVPLIKQGFETGADPWGRRWLPNKPSTLGRFAGTFGKSHFKKKGGLNSKGEARLASKRPLIGESRQLSTRIFYSVADGTLAVGSPMKYAAMQHFGGARAEFPNLWGDIPARPFMPIDDAGNLSPAAERIVVDTIEEYLLGPA